ncbi:MAG: cytochrome c oxidase assembly protein [Actinomycetota bacterium]
MSTNYSWTFEPIVLIGIAVALGIYLRRWQRVHAEYGARGASVWRLMAFVGGLLVVVVALVSPVDILGEQLAVMHMVQHILLLDIVPILLILGLTKILLRPTTRRLTRLERAAGWFAHPAFAVIAYVSLMWLWHIPALYDAALRTPAVHVLEHTCLLFAGSLYWWYLLSPIRSRSQLTGMGPVLYMISTKLGVGLLGILLAFLPTVLYLYSEEPEHWGLTHTTDQQLSGVLMATEQSIVMGIALAVILIRMLIEDEKKSQREELYGSQ